MNGKSIRDHVRELMAPGHREDDALVGDSEKSERDTTPVQHATEMPALGQASTFIWDIRNVPPRQRWRYW